MTLSKINYFFSDWQPVKLVRADSRIHTERTNSWLDLQLQFGRGQTVFGQMVQGQARILSIHARSRSSHQDFPRKRHGDQRKCQFSWIKTTIGFVTNRDATPAPPRGVKVVNDVAFLTPVNLTFLGSGSFPRSAVNLIEGKPFGQRLKKGFCWRKLSNQRAVVWRKSRFDGSLFSNGCGRDWHHSIFMVLPKKKPRFLHGNPVLPPQEIHQSQKIIILATNCFLSEETVFLAKWEYYWNTIN